MHNLRGRGREIDGTDLALSGSSARSTSPRRATWWWRPSTTNRRASPRTASSKATFRRATPSEP